ncbi:MAG: sulfatase-like hydrolase/transferase [Desulfobacterales bacterium]|nr:sulfatase-like hydrolase/transferase [Desulfobacterales bacterium]
MSSQISRRSFLKLLSLLSLTPLLNERLHLFEETSSLPQNQGAPNMLILVFDTLSAKHVSVYGYNRKTTPHLARFAERATVYHAHYAGGNFTPPGTASLLTGTYPWSHRAFSPLARVAESYKHRNLFRVFGETYNRIAYTHNWHTNVFLHQFQDDVDVLIDPREFYLFKREFLDQVFPNDAEIAYRSDVSLFRIVKDTNPGSLFLSVVNRLRHDYVENVLRRELANLYPTGVPYFQESFFLLEHAIDGIKTLISTSRQPFLGYFHLIPPHAPYRPRREFTGLFDDGWVPVAKEPHFFSEGRSDEFLNQKRRQYDEYIADTDAEFGRLYDFMAQAGMLDNTYVVFTTDHGEMFERGILAHSTPTLYEPIIRIPLLISKPKQQQREDVYTPTSCIDLLPTLLQVTGQTIPDWCEGEVLPTFGDKEASGGRSIFSVEACRTPKHAPLTKATAALIKDQYKLIHYFGYDGYENGYELYDLANDPEEMEDLYLSRKSVAADLQSELEEKLREVNQPYLSK